MRGHWILSTVASLLLTVAAPRVAAAQSNQVGVVADPQGWKLQVDGEDFMVFGMNWGYIPIGENYRYSLWDRPDEFIEQALDAEMALLEDMGVNSIRLFSDIPPRWIEYIYDRYGIMTAVNHLMGRYGFEVNGVFLSQTDYSDPATRRAILEDLQATVARYKDTRGVLMYLLGNENNYGLSWTSFEIEDLPEDVDDPRAEYLYTLLGEAATLVSGLDSHHPVSMVNGDINYLDVIARTCGDFDLMGANVYRGASSGDLFKRVRDELGVPFVYTEFGADAYDARRGREDEVSQAGYLLRQWQEIYEQSYGKGAAGTAVGGFIFQWSDGWWKFKQEANLDVHDTNASWATAAYTHDHVEGQNNMNEEWWGIAAKTPNDAAGFFSVTPRTSYYVLQQAFQLDPYALTTTAEVIRTRFGGIRLSEFTHRYATGRAIADMQDLKTLRLGNLRMNYESSISNGDEQTERGETRRFGHTESFWTDFELDNGGDLRGRLSLHGVGAVGQNRLDNIIYENRALERVVPAAGEAPSRAERAVVDRFAIYGAEFTLEQPSFTMEGFFRTGHFHWGYEGDFFGLYPEANYGPNLDTYNGQAPNGFEITGKGRWEGWKLAIGPELWWGANAAILAKYYKVTDGWSYSIVHHEDLVEATDAQTSFAVPEQLTRRTSVFFGFDAHSLNFEIGGLFSGSTKIGDEFTWVEQTSGRGYLDSGYEIVDDEVNWGDSFGGRARVTYEGGALRWVGQGSVMGIVADGGYQAATILTGWSLKESGRGNHWAVSTGASYRMGMLEIAPQVLYQQPLIEANPTIADFYSRETGFYYPAVRPRNVLDDPFVVLDNRETIGGELLLVYDPTPGTWYHNWDRDVREDAPFALALDIMYRYQPEKRDAYTFTLANGETVPFGSTPPAHDDWEAKLHSIHNLGSDLRVVSTLFTGQGEPKGDDPRLITRYGSDLQVWWRTIHAQTRLHIDDWGPYDFHRDFNLTYPLQWYSDLSYGLQSALLDGTSSRLGLRTQMRTLDETSPEHVADPNDPDSRGFEFEVGLYVHIGL